MLCILPVITLPKIILCQVGDRKIRCLSKSGNFALFWDLIYVEGVAHEIGQLARPYFRSVKFFRKKRERMTRKDKVQKIHGIFRDNHHESPPEPWLYKVEYFPKESRTNICFSFVYVNPRAEASLDRTIVISLKLTVLQKWALDCVAATNLGTAYQL